jgi:hypothetical protein
MASTLRRRSRRRVSVRHGRGAARPRRSGPGAPGEAGRTGALHFGHPGLTQGLALRHRRIRARSSRGHRTARSSSTSSGRPARFPPLRRHAGRTRRAGSCWSPRSTTRPRFGASGLLDDGLPEDGRARSGAVEAVVDGQPAGTHTFEIGTAAPPRPPAPAHPCRPRRSTSGRRVHGPIEALGTGGAVLRRDRARVLDGITSSSASPHRKRDGLRVRLPSGRLHGDASSRAGTGGRAGRRPPRRSRPAVLPRSTAAMSVETACSPSTARRTEAA